MRNTNLVFLVEVAIFAGLALLLDFISIKVGRKEDPFH
jgi:thiamine transporter ThiT